MHREYLADGVYVHFDGYQLWLTTERDGREHEIAIDPECYEALTNYCRKLKAKLAGAD